MRRALYIVLALGLLLAACGGGTSEDSTSAAEDRGVAVYEAMIRQQGGPVYEMLLPEHQAVVDRQLLTECLQDLTLPSVDVEATDSYTEEFDVPRVGTIETVAVTVNLSNEAGDININRTSHMIEQDGEWYWMLSDADLQTYEAGDCP